MKICSLLRIAMLLSLILFVSSCTQTSSEDSKINVESTLQKSTVTVEITTPVVTNASANLTTPKDTMVQLTKVLNTSPSK